MRLTDIQKLIALRHGGACFDPAWMGLYFFAALPHLISNQVRFVAAAVSWVEKWCPALTITEGHDWVADEAEKCAAKRRKFPKIDRLARTLAVADHEPAAAGLRAIPAVSRPPAVRDAEDCQRRKAYRKARRAMAPTYTPRDQSKAAQARAVGTTADAIRAKARRARIKAAESGQERPEATAIVAVRTPSRAPQGARDRVSAPTSPSSPRPGFGPYIITRAETKNHTSESDHHRPAPPATGAVP